MNSKKKNIIKEDDSISIRYFDIASQTSIEKVDAIEILPSSDVILSDSDFKNSIETLYNSLEKDKALLSGDKFEEIKASIEEIVDNIGEFNFSEKLYKYYFGYDIAIDSSLNSFITLSASVISYL